MKFHVHYYYGYNVTRHCWKVFSTNTNDAPNPRLLDQKLHRDLHCEIYAPAHIRRHKEEQASGAQAEFMIVT